jgi:hypothetical protein
MNSSNDSGNKWPRFIIRTLVFLFDIKWVKWRVLHGASQLSPPLLSALEEGTCDDKKLGRIALHQPGEDLGLPTRELWFAMTDETAVTRCAR